jgi:hypothetical protein
MIELAESIPDDAEFLNASDLHFVENPSVGESAHIAHVPPLLGWDAPQIAHG